MKKLLVVLAAAAALMGAAPATPYPYWACPPAWSPGPTVSDGCVYVGTLPATDTDSPTQNPLEIPIGLVIGFGLGAIGTVIVRKAAR